MRAYSVPFYVASAAVSKTLGTLEQPATALKRISIQYVQMGSNATADNMYQAYLQRITALGASPGTAITPQPRDAADGAASATAYVGNPTNEPTYTAGAIQLEIFAHQRATFQWYAAPGHDIVVPLTNANGIGIFMQAMTATANMGAVLEFEE